MASFAEDRALQAIQNEILEMIAYGEPLAVVADTLCRRIEDVAPETICSVLTVDRAGRLHPVAAPQLPDSYSNALDGLVVGPLEGSCGRAAALGVPVLVEDIDTDPLWAKYKSLALPLGLRACWSTPVKARGGKVIGTFALYYRTKRGPDALEKLAVDTCVHLCAIAIEQAEIQARVQQLAYFDTLTGLSNRSHADIVMKQKLQAPDGLGLLLIDIDNLKIANDTLGHAFGDELIRQVASRIAATARPGTACRIGGDEFLAILDDCREPDALKAAAERILASMETPFIYDGHTIVPHVTIGGALYGRDGRDSDTLRQNADLALYHSKETGRGRFVEFHDSLRIAMTRRIQTIRDLDAALNEGRIVTYYQPIVRFDTQDIIGLEALARLRNREGQIIAAAYFQEALKERRVARRLTDRILEHVAADVRSWLDMGIPFQHAGINVTTADFQGEELADRITAAFGKTGVPLKHVVLEVTETVFFGGSDSLVSESVKRLRSRGLRVALDDFGTGYASLTHLQTFPVDVIKIDKCFVERLVGDSTGEVIVAALIDIARKLGMRTVAEGVETEAQATRLQELGCTLGQGFWYYRPASFEETTDRLLSRAQGIEDEAEKIGPRHRRSVA
jgi:diguanylate cyclase (GGDEF)-like protein